MRPVHHIVLYLAAWVFTVVVTTTDVHAAPRTVLVLAVDGDADPAVRAQLAATLQRTANVGDAKVTAGDTTFPETAAAVGCDAHEPACAELVRTTLGVDELVYGTATATSDGTQVIVHRKAGTDAGTQQTVVVGPRDPPERAQGELAPLFGGTAPAQPIAPIPPPYDNRKRTRGIIFVASGGAALIVGLAMWSAKDGVQKDIDSAPTSSAADFARLEDLESSALKYAMAGNVLVLGGLALAGYGGWTLVEDRRERRVVVAPTFTPTAAGVTLGGTW